MTRTAPTLDDYATKYENVLCERDGQGVLQVNLHTDGKQLVWTATAEEELSYAFTDIANDPDNAAVVLTGTGDAWCSDIDFSTFGAASWGHIVFAGKRLLSSLLSIEVPVVAAINGPARIHSEMALLSDITVAADTSVFQDVHYSGGVVPGDGGHTVWTHVLGSQRGRYFLLTSQELDAATALQYGAVNEVVPLDRVLPRARELAAELASKPFMVRRYARVALTRQWRGLLHDQLEFGLVHEALAAMSTSS